MGLLLRDLLTMAEKQMEDAGVPDFEHDAKALLEYALGFNRTDIFMMWSNEIDDLRVDRYLEVIDRRASGEPLQYITGVQNFMGIEFKVNENVLIPRQDTERLVDNAKLIINMKNTKKTVNPDSPYIYESIMAKKNWKVLDLCTGSGCIGISLAKQCEGIKKVVMTDISPEALMVARENAKNAGVEKKIEIHPGDLYAPIKKKERFDMIISNPPYIRSEVIPTLMREVKDHEPMLALDGGEDGLDFYRRIVEGAPDRLNQEGVLALEIGFDQADDVVALIDATEKFKKTEVIKDYGNNDRIVLALRK